MKLKELLDKKPKNNIDRKIFSLLTTFIAILLFILILGIFFPEPVSIILNTLWVLLLISVAIFFALGLLVIIGMRKEVSRILDILLEGGLTFLEFLDFLKQLWKRFVTLLQEFLVFAAPIFAYIFAALVYIILIYFYKWVGKDNDVTLLTVGLTLLLITVFGIVNKPKVGELSDSWWDGFKKRFKAGFVDGSEVILFVFFLTMDSTNLFFLPKELNIPLEAKLGSYDLMVRSFVYGNNLKITVNIILVSVIVEIIRYIVRIYVQARQYYLQNKGSDIEDPKNTMGSVKESIRYSFANMKNDLIRFITFTTVLFIVFLLFPRLKLLTLAITSVTNLILDIFIRTRLTSKKGTDLISKILSFLFKV